MLTIYTFYDMFLHKELSFGVTMSARALKILLSLILFNRVNLTALLSYYYYYYIHLTAFFPGQPG